MPSYSQPKPYSLPEVFALLALAEAPQTGVTLPKQVARDSKSYLQLPRSSSYTLLERLENAGWAERNGKTFTLTANGRKRLQWMSDAVWQAQYLIRQRAPRD